jgi:hypothetical protein
MSESIASVDVASDIAQRIRFLAQIPAGAKALAKFEHPATRFAIAETAGINDLMRSRSSPQNDELQVVALPAGVASPVELQRSAEEWIKGGDSSGGPPAVELMLRSERVLWRPGKAVLIGPPDRLQEILPGLIEFAFHEGELRKLEREVDADWAIAEQDVDLNHSVNDRSLSRRRHVDDMTRRTLGRRMRFARLEPCLEKPSAALPGPARRLAGELALLSEAIERLGWLDDRIEVYEDLYELANDRLSEYSYFSREYRLELWIIVLLIAEVVIMGLELWHTLR